VNAVALVCAASLTSLIRWRCTTRWPQIGTIVVNLVGSFTIGVLHGRGVDSAILTAGALGGLTTVSGAAADMGSMRGRGRAGYLLLTVAGCSAGAWWGLQVA